MVYIIDTSMLIIGIVVLVIGIILYIAARYAPAGGISKILSFGGIILALIGMVLIVLSILLPLVSYAVIAPILLGG